MNVESIRQANQIKSWEWKSIHRFQLFEGVVCQLVQSLCQLRLNWTNIYSSPERGSGLRPAHTYCSKTLHSSTSANKPGPSGRPGARFEGHHRWRRQTEQSRRASSPKRALCTDSGIGMGKNGVNVSPTAKRFHGPVPLPTSTEKVSIKFTMRWAERGSEKHKISGARTTDTSSIKNSSSLKRYLQKLCEHVDSMIDRHEVHNNIVRQGSSRTVAESCLARQTCGNGPATFRPYSACVSPSLALLRLDPGRTVLHKVSRSVQCYLSERNISAS